jgi:hypothetical protein
MTCETGECPHDWHYARTRSLRGALERGRGLAVAQLRHEPERGELVSECTSRDTRWDSSFDERCVYLARLIRDLRLDVAPLVAQLRAGNEFDLAVGVLTQLARAGQEQPREALRAYVRDGIRWLDTVTTVAGQWPVEWWDDLWETAAGRIHAAEPVELRPDEQPWRHWRGRDPALDTALAAAGPPRPGLTAASDAQLLDLLRAMSTDSGVLNLALGWLRHGGRPVPEIFDLVDRLAPMRPTGLFGVRRLLGNEQDLPVLLTAVDRLADDDWCGYDALTESLARILADSSPGVHADTRTVLVRRLRWLSASSPHSYERTSYLRSLLLLDPERTSEILPIHLLDCQAGVRLLAARHTPLTGDARRWLTELRDDPIEDQQVRDAAAARLTAS